MKFLCLKGGFSLGALYSAKSGIFGFVIIQSILCLIKFMNNTSKHARALQREKLSNVYSKL
jgi:hypothetical protein